MDGDGDDDGDQMADQMAAVLAQLRSADDAFVWSSALEIVRRDGRGAAVVCARSVRPGELLIRVPPGLLLNEGTLGGNSSSSSGSGSSSSGTEDLPVHERLALALLARRRDGTDAWVRALPPTFEFMPAMWPEEELRAQLPARYRAAVEAQRERIAALARASGLAFEDAAWAYLAVNSRCLYWPRGGMTLAPAVDFLNHTCDQQRGASVSSDLRQGVCVRSTRAYAPGEELVFCYGPHENGQLLAEYGFVASGERNDWDFLDISAGLASRLPADAAAWLRTAGYYGDYTVDAAGEPSFRVEVALAAALGGVRRAALIASGADDGAQFAAETRRVVREIVAAQPMGAGGTPTLDEFWRTQAAIRARVLQ